MKLSVEAEPKMGSSGLIRGVAGAVRGNTALDLSSGRNHMAQVKLSVLRHTCPSAHTMSRSQRCQEKEKDASSPHLDCTAKGISATSETPFPP